MKKLAFWSDFKKQARTNRAAFITQMILQATVLAVLVRSLFLGNYEHAFICALTYVLFWVPTILSKSLNVQFPSVMHIIILVFIYSAEILGEIFNFYMTIPFWDTILHTASGFLFAAFGFCLADLLNKDPNIKFQLSPFYLALFSFCFSLMIGTMWEFFELSVDLILHKDMQKDTVIDFIYTVTLDKTNSNIVFIKQGIKDVILVLEDGTMESLGVGGYLDIGLYDTMEDMFVNFLGAVVFSVIGYFYVRSRGKGLIAKNFIPTIAENESDERSEEQT